MIPISQRLLRQIRAQQTEVTRRFAPEQRHYLLPRPRSNPDGRLHYHDGATVTFQAVARAAVVSRQWLY